MISDGRRTDDRRRPSVTSDNYKNYNKLYDYNDGFTRKGLDSDAILLYILSPGRLRFRPSITISSFFV
jgi:hypothetical protein